VDSVVRIHSIRGPIADGATVLTEWSAIDTGEMFHCLRLNAAIVV
jgi:hypothetical protein